jgi:cell pole-organizing protein PopZ
VDDILELTQQMIAQPLRDMGAGSPILSAPAQQHSTDALQELAKALLNKRDIAIGSREMTLEGLIREILRPLLREWLDQNLPYLIERLVKKEIDHMVNRAERLDL